MSLPILEGDKGWPSVLLARAAERDRPTLIEITPKTYGQER